MLGSDEVREVRLSELFDEGKSTLIVYGFMYGPEWDSACPSCTSITDGSNGIAPHVRNQTSFVVVAKAPPAKLRALAESRGWTNLRIVSAHANTFNEDYHAAYDDRHHPIANVFVRRDGVVHHFWASETYWVDWGAHPRHVDQVWPLWNWLDLTPEGRGDFMPKLGYE